MLSSIPCATSIWGVWFSCLVGAGIIQDWMSCSCYTMARNCTTNILIFIAYSRPLTLFLLHWRNLNKLRFEFSCYFLIMSIASGCFRVKFTQALLNRVRCLNIFKLCYLFAYLFKDFFTCRVSEPDFFSFFSQWEEVKVY